MSRMDGKKTHTHIIYVVVSARFSRHSPGGAESMDVEKLSRDPHAPLGPTALSVVGSSQRAAGDVSSACRRPRARRECIELAFSREPAVGVAM